jgi:hypothetical protein
MRAILKISISLIGLVALALIGFALMFWLGGNDVKNFCHEIKPGLPIAQLADLAKKYDVRLRLPGSREDSGVYWTLVYTPRSYGRHTCMVRHDNTVVIGSQYGYAD